MKNILAVLLTLVLFCVPYALGLATVDVFNIPSGEPPLFVYMFGVLSLFCIVVAFFIFYGTYLWVRDMID